MLLIIVVSLLWGLVTAEFTIILASNMSIVLLVGCLLWACSDHYWCYVWMCTVQRFLFIFQMDKSNHSLLYELYTPLWLKIYLIEWSDLHARLRTSFIWQISKAKHIHQTPTISATSCKCLFIIMSRYTFNERSYMTGTWWNRLTALDVIGGLD